MKNLEPTGVFEKAYNLKIKDTLYFIEHDITIRKPNPLKCTINKINIYRDIKGTRVWVRYSYASRKYNGEGAGYLDKDLFLSKQEAINYFFQWKEKVRQELLKNKK